MVKGAKSQVWKTVVVGVFLEDNATGVFGESCTVKDSRQPQGQSDLGELPLTERLELSAKLSNVSQKPSFSFTCFVCFSSHAIYTMLFVTMFVFIIECQLVLMKPPALSKQ